MIQFLLARYAVAMYDISSFCDNHRATWKGGKAMSNEKIQGAIEEYVEQIGHMLAEVANKKQLVNTMCNTISIPPRYTDIESPNIAGGRGIRQDEYYGRPFSTVAQEFLEGRRAKGACTAEEIAKGLEAGGFDFPWKDKDRVRMVAISLAKNSSVFQRLPNGTFGLLIWYPEIQKKKDEVARRNAKGGLGLLNDEETTSSGPDDENKAEGATNGEEENESSDNQKPIAPTK
jgi:hypothetical protein